MSSFFSGLQLNGRFGTGLAVVDINADGLSDLAVGAPSVGAADFQFHVGMLLRTFWAFYAIRFCNKKKKDLVLENSYNE